MRFKTVGISLFAVLAAAGHMGDLVSQMPACARKCLDEDSKKAGCAIDDHRCQCTKIPGIADGSAPCISTGCGSEDQKETTKIATEICLDVAHEVGSGTFNSAIHSLAGDVGSAFEGATSAIGSEFTSATGAAGDIFTSATAAVGDAYTSATAAAGGAYTSATAAVGDVLGGDAASAATSTPTAANQFIVCMCIVGTAAVFALAM
ncbi:hypothetical protein F4801DRAFT_247032 [Xylaria longipes]|nr:hypothetical protein F4801DRAFT_247032 [Xylaria longipes]RYC57711.1 hypothetical protein CHU98_g8490 [Xylaria longipes]